MKTLAFTISCSSKYRLKLLQDELYKCHSKTPIRDGLLPLARAQNKYNSLFSIPFILFCIKGVKLYHISKFMTTLKHIFIYCLSLIKDLPVFPTLSRFLGSLVEFLFWLQRFDWRLDNNGGNIEKVVRSSGLSLQHFLKRR